jgi:cytochrome c oxidase subunit 2
MAMTLLGPDLVRTRQRFILSAAALASASCEGAQSALVPAGRDAERILDLSIVMTVGGLLIWAAVVAVAIYAIGVGQSHSQRAANLLILGGGVGAPIVVLGALIAFGMPLTPEVLAVPEQGLSIRATAKQWWWRFEYLTAEGPIETANELRLPLGERSALQLTSPDVIHSFWVPSLAGKMDMIPGRVTRLALEPTRAGTFRGTCAEYCGTSHARMAFSVVVMEAAAFRAWLNAQARPASPARDGAAAQGAAAFFANGCTACHTIRGTTAAGRIGPDLTHIGSRRRVAAETLPNEPAALARWIRESAHVKPGSRMPAFRSIPADELSALTAYLTSLE